MISQGKRGESDKWDNSASERRIPRKRAAAAGLGVLMTSALALPGSMAMGRPLANGAGAPKASPAVAQAYRNEPAFPLISGLQQLLAGATGTLPRDSKPSAALLDNARSLAKFTTRAGRGARSRRNVLAELAGDPTVIARLPSGPLGIPGIMLQAYKRAQRSMAMRQPGCHLPWWLLAGIGQVESGQADGGMVDTQGNTLAPILGPELDGSNGTAAIPAFGGGWQRAIGPMQFIPSTWSIWGSGDPGNVFDAALAAGRYRARAAGICPTRRSRRWQCSAITTPIAT